MNIVLLGPPGAGKGTQAELIVSRYSLEKISSGDMLRSAIAEKSPLGLKAESYMKSGELVPSSLVTSLVVEKVKSLSSGVLLDGFPRTVEQARSLQDNDINIDKVVVLLVPDEIIVARMSGRLYHPGSGRTYHAISNPPKISGKDDITGEDLVIRGDDKADTVRNRLSVYHEQTSPVINFYKEMAGESKLELFEIDGSVSIDKVTESLYMCL